MDINIEHTDDEFHRLRARVHSLADASQRALIRQELSDVRMDNFERDISRIMQTSATSGDLKNAADLIKAEIGHLIKDVDAIKRVMLWTAGIVIFAVAGAILRLVLIA